MKYSLCDSTWGKEEYNALNRVIKSDRFSMGKEVQQFEYDFARKMDKKYAIMSNSGSSANLLAIAALIYSDYLKKGDEVIVPAVSWSTTYYPLTQHGLKLRFVDIDAQTLNIDVTQVESAITDKTKAIFAVNLLGNANDYDEIQKVCDKHDLILIEDNCESLGGTYNGKELGTFGVLGTYSTFYSHHICTMEGGVTVTDDKLLYEYMLSIRSHGWTRNLPENSSLHNKSDDSFYESFNFIVPGYNLRPLEMEGALGQEQLKKMDRIISTRRKNAQYFAKEMHKIEGIRIQKEIGESSWFGFALILEGKNIGKRKELVELLSNNDVEVRPIVAGNFTRNPVIKYIDYSIYGELKNADDIHDNGFFVGNHSEKNYTQVDMLVALIEEGLK